MLCNPRLPLTSSRRVIHCLHQRLFSTATPLLRCNAPASLLTLTRLPQCPRSPHTPTALSTSSSFEKAPASRTLATQAQSPMGSKPLTQEQLAILKACIPILEKQGLEITRTFYTDLLDNNPELRNIFNDTHQRTLHQPMALARALYAYAHHASNPAPLAPVLDLIAHKHASLGITADQYPIVGEGLLAAMAKVLGPEVFTEEVKQAWLAAYLVLADVLINMEAKLYESAGKWKGWKDFQIAKKVKESDEVTSFYLKPKSIDEVGGKPPLYKPGQYISVRVHVEGLNVFQARQYSLSDAPGKDYYRISVKREAGNDKAPDGWVSNTLHNTKGEGDVIGVSHPFGDFFFDVQQQTEKTPVVLLSGGVGLTSLMSILDTLTAVEDGRSVSWVHVAKNKNVRAFADHISTVVAENSNVKSVLFNSRPTEGEVEGKDYDFKGRLDLDKLDRKLLFLEDPKTKYFICGPAQFMVDQEKKLNSYGVPSERISMELFGTGGVQRAEEKSN